MSYMGENVQVDRERYRQTERQTDRERDDEEHVSEWHKANEYFRLICLSVGAKERIPCTKMR